MSLDSRVTSGVLPYILTGQPTAVLNRSRRFSRASDVQYWMDVSIHRHPRVGGDPVSLIHWWLKPVLSEVEGPLLALDSRPAFGLRTYIESGDLWKAVNSEL